MSSCLGLLLEKKSETCNWRMRGERERERCQRQSVYLLFSRESMSAHLLSAKNKICKRQNKDRDREREEREDSS